MSAPTSKETKQWKMLIEKLDQEKNKWRISSFDIVAKKNIPTRMRYKIANAECLKGAGNGETW